MINRRRMTALVLTLGFVATSVAGCDTQTERYDHTTPVPGGTAASPSPAMNQTPTPATSPVAGLSSFDQEFMMDAARRGMMEVQLGNMAAQKAANNEVRRFGQRIATDHSRANQRLQQLASNLNVTLPQELDPNQQREVSKLQDLSGREFDREFMSLILRDHAEEISKYERAANQATNQELRQFASQSLPTLREHEQMARNVAGRVGVRPSPRQ